MATIVVAKFGFVAASDPKLHQLVVETVPITGRNVRCVATVATFESAVATIATMAKPVEILKAIVKALSPERYRSPKIPVVAVA